MANVPTKPLLAENKATTMNAYASLLLPMEGSARHKKSGKNTRRMSMRMTSQRLGLFRGTRTGTDNSMRPTQSNTLKQAMSSVTNLLGASEGLQQLDRYAVLQKRGVGSAPVVEALIGAAHFSQYTRKQSERNAKVASDSCR